jgi:hypothetical protein
MMFVSDRKHSYRPARLAMGIACKSMKERQKKKRRKKKERKENKCKQISISERNDGR